MFLREVLAVQDTTIRYVVRQGIAFEFDVEWLEEDGVTPRTFNKSIRFIAAIRTGLADNPNATTVVSFTTDVPTTENNDSMVFDDVLAKLTFHFDDLTCQGLTANQTYYFEVKLIDDVNDAIDSFQAEIIARPDVVRPE